MAYRNLCIELICVLSLLVTVPATATQPTPMETLKQASGTVLLTVSGAISNPNAEDTAQFDLPLLESLPAVQVSTSTPWTQGLQKFTGVRVSDLLKRTGAKSQNFLAKALDDYNIEVTNVDFEQHPIIIAYKRNGAYMSLRDLGPLWLIFPFDEHPEFTSEKHLAYSVWQLYSMVIR